MGMRSSCLRTCFSRAVSRIRPCGRSEWTRHERGGGAPGGQALGRQGGSVAHLPLSSRFPPFFFFLGGHPPLAHREAPGGGCFLGRPPFFPFGGLSLPAAASGCATQRGDRTGRSDRHT